MSLEATVEDVLHGNFSHAFVRVEDWWNSDAFPELKLVAVKVATDEGHILEGLLAIAAKDVVSGGFTTAAFVAAGEDVLTQLVAQNIATFNIQYIIGLLNIKVAALAPPVVLPVAVAAVADPAPAA